MKDSDIYLNQNSKEYKLGGAVAATLRDRTNNTLGDVLTLIEASMSNSEQAKALKQLVKQAFWKLTDANQHTVYYAFGQEPRQLHDSIYIEEILNGTDGQPTPAVTGAQKVTSLTRGLRLDEQ